MLVLLLALACSPDDGPAVTDDTGVDEPDGPEFYDPSTTGPYAVGTTMVSITGTSGVELDVQIWYPAAEGADEELHAYDGLVTYTALDEPEADCSRTRPVLAFSHGNGGLRFQSTFYTEFLASHGWVVVAPDHTLNTAFDYDDDALGEVMLRRPVDVADSYDLLLTDANPAVDCVDEADGYAVSGHSFGGFTTLATAGAYLDLASSQAYCDEVYDFWLCSALEEQAAAQGQDAFDLGDDRVWAAVAMAPAGYEVLLAGLPDIEVPTLIWGGDWDEVTSYEYQVGPIYDGLSVSPRYLGMVADTGHYSFSNACDLVGSYDDCDEPFKPPEEVHAIVDTVTTAFLAQARGIEGTEQWLPTDEADLSWTAN